jgi:hypothetical protein
VTDGIAGPSAGSGIDADADGDADTELGADAELDVDGEPDAAAAPEEDHPGATASVVAFEIPASEFVFRDALAGLDDVTVEAERVVAHHGDRIVPLVWACSGTTASETITGALQADLSVESVEVSPTSTAGASTG